MAQEGDETEEEVWARASGSGAGLAVGELQQEMLARVAVSLGQEGAPQQR